MSEQRSGGGFRSRSKAGSQRTPQGGQRREQAEPGGTRLQGGGSSRRGGRVADRARGGGNGRQQTRDRSSRGGSRSGARQQETRWNFHGVDAARRIAFSTIYKVMQDDAFANLVLPAEISKARLDSRDAAFATEIGYGTLRSLGILDAVIAASSSRPIEEIAPEVLAALRLGAYQVLFTRVEDHAAVDTTVRLVEGTGQVRAKGFANAVMRTITRTPAAEWITQLTPADPVGAVAFRHAHPQWIAQSFATALGVLPTDQAGREELDAALAADSERPHVHLVARPGEITAEELALVSGGEEGKYSPYAVYLESGDPGKLDAVQEGLAGVQDEGSQLIARALTEAPLEGADSGKWLDLCAGPGGKAALLGALARIDGAHVDAVEIAPHRAKLISQAVRDLPVNVLVGDGRNVALPQKEGSYDRVLVDAPCSGLGALRRRPEARWRKQEADIAQLAGLQKQLLTRALQAVRPGGVVVYSTCSPDVRETRQVVDAVLAHVREEMPVQELDARAAVSPMEHVGEGPSVQMWPHRHGTDAMFFAVLQKGGPTGA